jgi:hypothetical protein
LGIRNPTVEQDTSPFSIKIYESWDDIENVPSTLLSEKSDFNLVVDDFTLDGGIMTDGSMAIS